MKVSAAVNAVSPNASVGEQRQDGAFLADHAADERVDPDEQAELGEVLAQPEPQPAAGRWASASSVDVQGVGRWPRPSRRAAGEHRDVAVAGAVEEAGAPVMARSPCPHITGSDRRGSRSAACGERAELDVARAGEVAGGVLAVAGGRRAPIAARSATATTSVDGGDRLRRRLPRRRMPPSSSPTRCS